MSTEGAPTSYTELAEVVEHLPILVRERRRVLGWSVRETGRRLGAAGTTIARIEDGQDYNSRLLPVLLRWLGTGVTS